MGAGLDKYEAIVFDLGGVLIDWNPMYVFGNYFDDPAHLQYFFDEVCTTAWNEEQDAGKPLAQATEERIALFPEWEQPIRDYYGRWREMLAGQIDDTVAILKELKAAGQHRLLALTNWSRETFPVALEHFEFLHDFEGILVSGQENLAKPDPAIFRLMINRYELNPVRTIYIDDNLRNVKAAAAIGFEAIHFTSPLQLSADINNLMHG